MEKNIKFDILSIVCIIVFCISMSPITLQNDTFYTIKIGEYILDNGITYMDPFSWHENLSYTFPHWLYDVMIYAIFNVGGYLGIYISTIAFACILGIILYATNVKLNKFISLIQSVLKWIAGICFSVFLGILAFHGIVAGSFDSVSIRATRLAIKSYVPVLGSYISDGFNIVCASSVLIKNVVGVAGIFLLFASILTPVFQILACSMLLRLTASILEPIGETRIPDFLQQIAKTLNLLIMMILGVAFMYVITIGLILCTANIF